MQCAGCRRPCFITWTAAPTPVDRIAAVADALHDRLEIICDGGIRRGNHVVKALAGCDSVRKLGRSHVRHRR